MTYTDIGYLILFSSSWAEVSCMRIYYNWWILLVMTLHVELLLLRELACVDGGRDVGITIAEPLQPSSLAVVHRQQRYCQPAGQVDHAQLLELGVVQHVAVEVGMVNLQCTA